MPKSTFMLLFFSTLAMALFTPAAVDADAPVLMKVMSFNVRTTLANDPCPSGCWAQRKERIKQLLAKYTPDFIGTQEGAPDQIQFFQDTLGYAAVGECAGACDWNERDSIFYVQDRWTLLEGSTFALSDTPEIIPSNTWNLAYLRTAVLARFQHKQMNHTVCMLNTHYDIGTNGHDQSSLLVAKRLAAFCKPTDTVLMTGDLNAPANTPAMQYLANSTQLNGAYTPIPLYETLIASGVPGATWIGSSFGGQPAGDKLDYIYSRRDAQTCLRSAQIITDTFDGGFGCSDHALVQAEFLIGADCASANA